MVQLVKETQVLSATTANPINEEKILSEGSDTITTTPIDNLVPTIIEDEIADTSLNIKTSPIPTKTTIEATPKVSPTDHILNEINKFRESHGISRVTKENYSCDFANIRARELASSFTHDGFEQRKNNDLLPFPNWSNVTENIAMNSNYLRVIDQWTSSPGHAENILADTPHICVGKYENYFAMIGWKP